MPVSPIVGVLLCGGSATRFGGDKLMEGDDPIAARAARALVQGGGQAIAVVPTGGFALRDVLKAAGCTVVESDQTSFGMGASLAAGIGAAAGARGWIVALGDMPAIRPQTIAAVRAALEGGAAIAAPHDGQGRRGHPVGFSAAFRDELLALRGDVAAREIVAWYGGVITRVVTDDPGIFIDVDTREDLMRLHRGE